MKAALYFAAGVVVGSAATFFAVRGYLEKKADERAEQRIQEEVQSVKDSYLKRAAARDLADKNAQAKKDKIAAIKKGMDIRRQGKQSEEKNDSDDGEILEETREERRARIRLERAEEKRVQEARKSYNRNVFEEPYTSEEDIFHNGYDPDDDGEPDEDDLDDIEEETPNEGLRPDPYPISADEFANEKRTFDKTTIFLYADETAVDDQERIVDDLEQLIGIDNYNRIGELLDSENVALIRNEMRSTDYEIIVIDEDYIPDTAPVLDE